MTERYPVLYRSIQGVALLMAASALLFPGEISHIQAVCALVLILFGGIPHGATDFVIFRHMQMPVLVSRKMATFLGLYIALMGIYSFVWWMVPLLGLLIFLGISVYHFGQSNWNYISFPSKFQSKFTYVLWGSWVLFFPVIWHFDEAAPIIGDLLGISPLLIVLPWSGKALATGLAGLTLLWIFYQKSLGTLSTNQTRDECINLGILSFAFTQLPLLLGFALYFVAWHSFSSILDQIGSYRKMVDKAYNFRHYLKDVWLFSLMAILFTGVWMTVSFQSEARIDWAFLFVFISVVTLPHMLLIDQLYSENHEKKPQIHER